MTADTPRTDAVMASSNWPYHITFEMKKLERELSASTAEVERLKGALIECLEITSIYDSIGDYETACDIVYDIAANALKTQDNK
jgi:hypothetical protein